MHRLVCMIKGHRYTRHTQDDGHTVGHCARCGYMTTLFTGWRATNKAMYL